MRQKHKISTLPEARTQQVDSSIFYEVQQHYHREFRTLQHENYEDWLHNYVSEDIHYWMPVLEQRLRKDKRRQPTPDDAAIFNEDYLELKQRIDRLNTGAVWMEDPPSRIRYFMTNLEVYTTDKQDELETFCNVMVIRNRRQVESSQHSIGREDLLKREGSGFRVLKRKLLIDARVTQDKNLYFFS